MEAFQCANTLTTHALEEIVLWRCQMPMLHYHRSQHLANKLATYILLRCGCEVFYSLHSQRFADSQTFHYHMKIQLPWMPSIDLRVCVLLLVSQTVHGGWRVGSAPRSTIIGIWLFLFDFNLDAFCFSVKQKLNWLLQHISDAHTQNA